MTAAESVAGDFTPHFSEAFSCVSDLLDRVMGAVREMSGGRGPGMARRAVGGGAPGGRAPRDGRRASAGSGATGGRARPGPPGFSPRPEGRPRGTCAPRSWPCCGKARATGTRSCPRSRSAAAAPGGPAPGLSTRRWPSSPTRAWSRSRNPAAAAHSASPGRRRLGRGGPGVRPARRGSRWRRHRAGRGARPVRPGRPAWRHRRAGSPRRHTRADPGRRATAGADPAQDVPDPGRRRRAASRTNCRRREEPWMIGSAFPTPTGSTSPARLREHFAEGRRRKTNWTSGSRRR